MIKVIYAADTIQQYKLLKRSLESLTVCNSKEEVSLVFLFHEKIQGNMNELISICNDLGYKSEIKIFTEPESRALSESKPGMMYWLFAPLLFEGKKFLQLDNDTIVNTKIRDVFEQVESQWDKKAIFGVKTNILFNTSAKRSLNQIHGKKNINKFSNYINYGVVLINSDNYLKIFENTSNLLGYIKDKTKIARDFLLAETDQEIFFERFKDVTGFIPTNFNARIHRMKDFNWKSWDEESNSYILHFNLYSEGKGKFNFLNFIENPKSFEDKTNDLKSFYFLDRKEDENKNEYIDVISKIILTKNTWKKKS